ncbi:MAG: HAMP domain-containing protein [Deltaproteobacteria bacterium]|nr:HAMP domain-containing protein [Deltaproteobacteria bacterium]
MSGILGLRDTILLLFAGAGVVCPVIVVLISYVGARTMLAEQAFDHLTTSAEQKAQQLDVYFQGIEDHIASLAADPSMADTILEMSAAAEEVGATDAPLDDTALRSYYSGEFLSGFEANGNEPPPFTEVWPSEPARQLQTRWIADSPQPTGSKMLVDSLGDSTAYDRVHARHHPHLRLVHERFGYYDLFLISPEGRVVYSVFKEVDFGTSLHTGPWRETGLAEVFRAAVETPGPGAVQFVDFAPYGPSYGAWASFMGVPVLDGDELVGVLAVQMPVGRINEIMTNDESWEDVGMGRSGETYLVGQDQRLRSQSRFLIQNRAAYLEALSGAGVPAETLRQIDRQGTGVGLQEVTTKGALAALDGRSGVDRFSDYRGIAVLSSFRSVDVGGVTWALMSEIDREEAFAPAQELGRRTVTITLVGLAAILLMALWLARNLLGPVRALASRAEQIAAGDLDTPIDLGRGDELGDLAVQIERMRVSLRDLVHRQEAAIDALKVPIIPLNESTLVLPLVGVLDAHRLELTRHDLVEAAHRLRATTAIIDITGVPSLAREDAAQLARMADAVRLIGTRLILTGMRPQVASVIADLDEPLKGVRTERTLQSGIHLAEQLQGRTGSTPKS